MPTPTYLLEARGKAEEIRQKLGLGFEAIKDIFHLLQEQGLDVLRYPLGEDDIAIDGLYYHSEDIVLIAVNSDKWFGRQRFTAAHEFAHHLFERTSAVDKDLFAPTKDIKEKRANAFAAHFLMPESGLSKFLERKEIHRRLTAEAVVHLQRHFGASYEAVLYHLQNLQFITSNEREKLQQFSPTNVAFMLGYLDELQVEKTERHVKVWPTRYVQKATHAYQSGKITIEKLADLLEFEIEELKRRLEQAEIKPPEVTIEEIKGDVEQA